MNVLHLLTSGETGGIESLVRDYDKCTVHNNFYIFIWNGGIVADELISRGKSVYILNKTNKDFFCVLSKMARVCKKNDIHVIITHHSSPMLKLLIIFLKMIMSDITTITYAHANAYDICQGDRHKGLFFRKIIHHLGFLSADGIIAISKSVKTSLNKYFNLNKKIDIIYNGILLEKFINERNHKLDFNNRKVRFIYVGRLIKEKGVQTTIDYFSKLPHDILERVELSVIGNGPYYADLFSYAKKSGLEKVITFFGNRTDVPKLLSDHDFFLHFPIWEEGFGIAIIEALASGLVCLCNNKGAIPELISHKCNGFLVNNYDEFLFTLVKILEDDFDYDGLRENAIISSKKYSIEVYTQRFDQYIIDLCKKKRGKNETKI